MLLTTKLIIFFGLLLLGALLSLSTFFLYKKVKKSLSKNKNYQNTFNYKMHNLLIFALIIIVLASFFSAITIFIF